ncbi:MAG: hypothetical protein O3A00_19710, partial [Planctomycetota bacterium]|nr:hypothetical protein [Planctomycetota bacterium]
MTDINTHPEFTRCPRSVYWVMISVGTALTVGAILQAKPLLSANDRSRWCTVRALVDEGTYEIDDVITDAGWNTIDKVRHEGHFYSSKPALFPTMVAGVYWAVQQVTSWIPEETKPGEFTYAAWTLQKDTEIVSHIILIVVNLIPMVIAWILLACLLERYAVANWTRIFILATAIFSTFLTTFLVTLNNHTIAACSLVYALYFTLRIVADGQWNWKYYAAAGFFAAFTCTSELPAALFGAWLFFYLGTHSWKTTFKAFVPAALIPLAAFFCVNYESTGGWKPFYMYYGTEKYMHEYEGQPSHWVHPTDMDRSVDTPAVYFMHCTIGHHGVLSLSPVFLFSILGVFAVGHGASVRLMGIVRSGALLTLGVLAFYMTRSGNYNFGGNTSGLRWMFWLIPFWLICMIPALDRWGRNRFVICLAALCLGVSTYTSVSAMGNPWTQPWLFTALQKFGYLEQYNPAPHPELDRRYRSWIGDLPDHADDGPWVEFAGTDFDGTAVRLRITRVPNTVILTNFGGDIDNYGVSAVEVRWQRNGEWDPPDTYYIHAGPFAGGNPPRDFLAWDENAMPSKLKRKAVEDFFRG